MELFPEFFAVRTASDSRERVQEASLESEQTKERHQFVWLAQWNHQHVSNQNVVRAIKNSQQVWNNCCESKCHATVQTMLDHRGDKHQASATPCIISRLKIRHSDKKTSFKTSDSKPKLPVWGAKRPGAGRVSVRAKRWSPKPRITMSKLFPKP